MFKIDDFNAATQILREINFRNSQNSKTAIFAIYEALKLHFDDFLAIFESRNLPKTKMAVFELGESLKMISRKI